MLPSLGFSHPTTHARATDPRDRAASRPRGAPRTGFGYPLRDSTAAPASARRRPSVHGLHPTRPSPRAGRPPFRGALPSWRCTRLSRPLPGGADGRGRLQGFDPDAELVQAADPCGPARRCLPGLHPSRALSPPVLARVLGCTRGPPPRVGRDDVPARLRLGVLRTGGSVGPSRGYRLSWVSSPFDGRGTARTAAGGGLIASPQGPRACRRANPSEPPRTRPSRSKPRPGTTVHR
jgi:hypothetical protein